MVVFFIESEDPLLAEKAMARLHRVVREQIETLGFDKLEILGPAPAAIIRIMKKYRWNLATLSRSAKRLNTLARATRAVFEPQLQSGKVAMKIDLDPYGMF